MDTDVHKLAMERLQARGLDTSWLGTGGYVVDSGSPEAEFWEDQNAHDDWVADGFPDLPGVKLTKAERELLAATPLTVAQAARREGVSERTVYRWLKSGELDAHRVGTGWRITTEALDARRIASKMPKPAAPVRKHRPRKRKVAEATDAGWWPS